MVFKRCVTQEDAQSPERWMARQSEKGDCKLTPGERTGDSMRWEMSVPQDQHAAAPASPASPARAP